MGDLRPRWGQLRKRNSGCRILTGMWMWESGNRQMVTLVTFRRPSYHPGQSLLYSIGGFRVSTQNDKVFGGRRHSRHGRDEVG